MILISDPPPRLDQAVVVIASSSCFPYHRSQGAHDRYRRVVSSLDLHHLVGRGVAADSRIWIFHAAVPQSGENPFMRTIFFKITSLLHQPVLPVFVFDGPAKPGYKRNQRVGGSFGTSDTRSRQFKELLDEMGMEWWNVSLALALPCGRARTDDRLKAKQKPSWR